jgi:hypoxanthine phosphoribosyltransferase
MIKSDPIIMDRLNEGGLVAISRGGLVPATLLSHMLDVQIAYMIDPNQSAIMPNNRKYVVVDDICDTGKTFEAVRGAMPNVSRVALFCKHAGEEECDAYAMIVPNHVWIHFPWETFA